MRPFGIDRYQLLWPLGSGGMGEVFSARLHRAQAGCAGGLAAVSDGRLSDQGGSYPVNSHGGLPNCAVHSGDLWLGISATVGVSTRAQEGAE